MGQQKPLVALMLSTFLQQLVFSSNFKSIFRDEGDNVTLICPASLEKSANLNWIITDAQAKEEFQNQVLNNVVQDDGSLFLENVSRTDSHLYTCQDAENNQSLGSIKLQICGVPSAVNNFTAITHSVYALVTWNLDDDGGYPVEKFVLKYRLDESLSNSTSTQHWNVIDHLKPNTSSMAVFHLMPNSTYYFRIQAVNKLGPGNEISLMAKTKYDLDEVKKANDLLSIEQENSSSFYMKVTIVTICLVLITFAILSLGISLVLFRNCGQTGHTELNCEATEDEVMELVPHITLNPSFNIDMLEYIEAEASPTDACERTNLVQPRTPT